VERKRIEKDMRRKRRARLRAVRVEPVNSVKVYERDRWRCGLCGKQVNKRLEYPHPMSASLDHVIPLSLGGEHSMANVQLAHLSCNVEKSNGGWQQLALIG
jgi:5-methylcytosine-specific restriction endonuclease McrA